MPYTSEAERGYVVACHTVANIPIEEIAGRPEVDMSERTIRRWVSRFNISGFEGLKTHPKPGRDQVTTPEQDAAIEAVVRRNHRAPASTIVYEAIADVENVGRSTIYNRLNSAGLRARSPAEKTLLQEAHREERFNLAVDYVERPEDFWVHRVFFSDEKNFRSDTNGTLQVWRARGTRYEEENIRETTASGHVTASFWGCVYGGGTVCLVPTTPRMNAAEYVRILEENLIPRAAEIFGEEEDFYFVQDNAPIHNANLTMQFFRRHPWVRFLRWPRYSPDCNYIEHVWGTMVKEWVAQRERNVEALRAHVMEVWASLGRRPEYFRKLAASMPRRWLAVIEGGYTKY